MIKVGDYVRWTSQSGGNAKTKEGDVIAIVPKLHDATLAIPKDSIDTNRQKFQRLNMVFDRAVVAVRRKSGIYDYYAPSISWVKAVD